jgi:hypothetical protein
MLIEDALCFWYATYYSQSYLATPRRVNIIVQFHKTFMEEVKNKEYDDLLNAVNRKDNGFFKETFNTCKIYLQLQKQQEYIDILKYMLEIIGFVISKNENTDNTISENIIKPANKEVDII